MSAVLDLAPNTPAWLAHRAQHLNASDAPAMMGCSQFKTRAQLLHEMHTGIAPDVDAATQRRFDEGHRIEALTRPLAEEIIGDDLAPQVAVKGRLSASLDGLTLMGDVAWECKTLNDVLLTVLVDGAAVSDVPLMYRVQLEQQLHCSGAARTLFQAAKWQGDALVEERHVWYEPDLALRAQIIAGWAQFDVDLATYVPPPTEAAPAVGKAPDTLPALRIEVTGMVTASNLAEFKETALFAIRSVNRDLSTDQDFADATKAVKWCEDVETRLKAAKEHALSQTASIDALFKTIDDISAEARRVRLDLDKLVTRRKTEVKEEIVKAGYDALQAHITGLNRRLDPRVNYLPTIASDFAGVIKGLRTIYSLRNAIDTELARAKIEASGIADRIDANLKTLAAAGEDVQALFADRQTLVLKPAEDLAAVVANRIAERRAAEERRIEADRARIRAEEQARLAREAEAAEADRVAQLARIARDAQAAAMIQAAAKMPSIEESRVGEIIRSLAAPAPTPPAATTGPAPTLTVGQIAERLAPLKIDAAGLQALGFARQQRPGAATHFLASDWYGIKNAIVRHIGGLE